MTHLATFALGLAAAPVLYAGWRLARSAWRRHRRRGQIRRVNAYYVQRERQRRAMGAVQ
jgi:hypothetical protein